MSEHTPQPLPCPLCGADLLHNGQSELGDIFEHPFNGCAIQVAWFTATPEWVAAWNRRVPDARIAELEGQLAEANKFVNRYAWERDKAREERDAAEARLAKAVEALRPFAAEAYDWGMDYPSPEVIRLGPNAEVTVADCIHAATTLSELEAE